MPSATFPIEEIPTPSRAKPVVVSVPHSGTQFPDDERSLYKQDPEALALLGDLYVDALFEGACRAGATVVRTPYSRFVVDLNRYPDDLSPESVRGEQARSPAGYHGKRGVIWAVSPNGYNIYHRPLTKDEARQRLQHYYYPYHDAVFGHLQRLKERFGYVILIDAHSMPSQPLHLLGRSRADIVPGDLDGRSCSPLLSEFVIDWWADNGYSVAPNYPYKGGAVTRQHGRPHHRIHAIQLEFNRALYMDEGTLEHRTGFATLQLDCERFVQSVGQHHLNADCAAE